MSSNVLSKVSLSHCQKPVQSLVLPNLEYFTSSCWAGVSSILEIKLSKRVNSLWQNCSFTSVLNGQFRSMLEPKLSLNVLLPVILANMASSHIALLPLTINEGHFEHDNISSTHTRTKRNGCFVSFAISGILTMHRLHPKLKSKST